jgi:hypothetical protein
MNYDPIGLRLKLREAINVHQIGIYTIAKGSGVPAPVLGEFLADGPLAEDQALYLHSWLHYKREAMAEDVRKLERGVNVSFLDRFRILAHELIADYNVQWYASRDFCKLSEARKRVELLHMEECLKGHLLKRYAVFIAREHVRLPDGCTYWKWKEILLNHANKAFAAGRRSGPYGPWPGDDHAAEAVRPPAEIHKRPRSLLWRGGA